MKALRKALRMARGRLGIAVFAMVIGAGGVGVTAVAFARQGTPTGSGAAPKPTSASPPAPSGLTTCSSQGMRVSVESSEGAAGTMRYVWRAENVGDSPCEAYGYAAIDFHAPTGWMNVAAQHGGFSDIDGAPKHIVVAPGHSLYFASYWSDVTTDRGSCQDFDQVRVTMPSSDDSNVVGVPGCLTPDSVRVGPLSAKLPAF